MRGSAKVSPRSDPGAVWKPSSDTLEVLTSSLENSTVGVAFYDQRLRCQAVNQVFAELCSLRIEDFLGKRLNQTFDRDAKKLQSAFERALSTGTIVSNVELLPASAVPQENHRRLINVYPLADRSGRVRVIAVTLCASAAGDTLEFHFARLVAQLQEELLVATCLLGASFPEILARSLQSSSRALHKIKNSMAPRSVLSGTQPEIGLLPLALFLSLTGSRSAASETYVSSMELPETSEETGQFEGSSASLPPAEPSQNLFEVPSPRELQVLRLLAIGQSNKEIGLALGISTRTVETYRARIIRKLSLHSTAELVRYAIRHKIVEP
jgi:DNA-binding NarL/FixJ family response regulator